MTVGRIPSVEGGIQPTIVDAKGDLIVATGNDSPNRLAVGANNLVLTADSAQATGLKWAAPDPLTTKGDLFTYSTIETRLGVGANDTVLMADSTAATGIKWATLASGGMTLISTTTLTGASVTLSSIPQTYKSLYVVIKNFRTSSVGADQCFRFNADATANRHDTNQTFGPSTSTFLFTLCTMSANTDATANNGLVSILFPDYTNATTWKQANFWSMATSNGVPGTSRNAVGNGQYNQTVAITSLQFLASTGNLASGTVLLYGVN